MRPHAGFGVNHFVEPVIDFVISQHISQSFFELRGQFQPARRPDNTSTARQIKKHRAGIRKAFRWFWPRARRQAAPSKQLPLNIQATLATGLPNGEISCELWDYALDKLLIAGMMGV
jgi:hypothetical protein